MSFDLRVRSVTTICTITLLAIGMWAVVQTKQAATQSADEVRKVVDAANSRLGEALRRADAATVTEMFAADGMIVLGNSCFNGRAEIEQRMLAIFKQAGPAATVDIETTSMWVDRDLAYESGRWAYTYPPKDNAPSKLDGRYLVIWRRQSDGSWKIFRDIRLPT